MAREDVYMVRCGQVRADKKRCPAVINVIARTEREAREKLKAAAAILGWRLGAMHHNRCASHQITGGFNGTWIEL